MLRRGKPISVNRASPGASTPTSTMAATSTMASTSAMASTSTMASTSFFY